MSSAGQPTAYHLPTELPFIDEHSIDVNTSPEDHAARVRQAPSRLYARRADPPAKLPHARCLV
jgi:hypothetical protein